MSSNPFLPHHSLFERPSSRASLVTSAPSISVLSFTALPVSCTLSLSLVFFDSKMFLFTQITLERPAPYNPNDLPTSLSVALVVSLVLVSSGTLVRPAQLFLSLYQTATQTTFEKQFAFDFLFFFKLNFFFVLVDFFANRFFAKFDQIPFKIAFLFCIYKTYRQTVAQQKQRSPTFFIGKSKPSFDLQTNLKH
jgi:hypothetical protein